MFFSPEIVTTSFPRHFFGLGIGHGLGFGVPNRLERSVVRLPPSSNFKLHYFFLPCFKPQRGTKEAEITLVKVASNGKEEKIRLCEHRKSPCLISNGPVHLLKMKQVVFITTFSLQHIITVAFSSFFAPHLIPGTCLGWGSVTSGMASCQSTFPGPCIVCCPLF